MMVRDQKKSIQNNCWNCKQRNKGGINFFGTCTYFETPKEIPSNIVDEGCKFWVDENYIEQLNLF